MPGLAVESLFRVVSLLEKTIVLLPGTGSHSLSSAGWSHPSMPKAKLSGLQVHVWDIEGGLGKICSRGHSRPQALVSELREQP